MTNNQDIRHILVIEDTNGIHSLYLESSTYSIGRHSNSSIVLASRLVSRHHATLLKVKYSEDQPQELYWIIDGDLKGNRSRNGLLINGKRCFSHELKSGDVIVLAGDVKANYYKTPLANEEENKIDLPIEKSINLENTTVKNIDNSEKITIVSETSQDSSNNLTQEILSSHLNLAAELLPHPIIEINQLGEITYINEVAEYKFPNIRTNSLEHPLLEGLVDNLDKRKKNLLVREVKIGNELYEQYAHYLSENQLIRSYIFDLTKRKQIETALKESEERYQAVVRQISEGILLIDPNNKKVLDCNNAYCQLLGYKIEEIIKLSLYDLISEQPEIIDSYLEEIFQKEHDLMVESIHCHQNTKLISVEMNISLIAYGEKKVICFAVRDITARKRSEELLKYQVSHDLLTDLPNRLLFNQKLMTEIQKAEINQTLLAVMFLDIDHFKKVNDTLGHAAGDQLLKSFAHRIQSCFRTTDMVARWGGDEFTILLPEIIHVEDVAQIAERILETLKEPFEIDKQLIHVGLSMGIALYPQDGQDEETLLKNADAVLYRAKEQGRNHYRFYNPMVNSQASNLLRLENFLYEALEKEEFFLHYQPRVNSKTFEITGVEALIRWKHPERGYISPVEFIPLAEETGLIIPIGEWVLYTACRQNKIWHDLGFSSLKVAVNISPRQFQQGNLVSLVHRVLEETGLDHNFLELEITESIIINNVDYARKSLTQLADMGVNLAIDDFGTGYSSLAYLKKFPFHYLKIDQSFVRDMEDRPEDIAIVSAVITLAKGFNLTVIAEGVENETQLELLSRLECEEMQGYWFGRPMCVEDITEFIRENHRVFKNSRLAS